MDNLNKQERRALKRQRRRERKEKLEGVKKASHTRTYILVTIVIASMGYLAFLISASPGTYDSFAKCLTESGAVVYGNDWCKYTQEQMSPFGKSSAHLNYMTCDDNTQLCNEKGVAITPTWEINGKTYAGVQTFEELSRISGCGF